MYIYELSDWPNLYWSEAEISLKVAELRHQQGRIVGKMEALGISFRQEAVLQTLTEDVLKSSEIEGEILNKEQVRSSLARRLGMDVAGLTPTDRNVEGVVEMMLDATQNYKALLTKDRLFGWHCALFPTGRSGMHKIVVGNWRSDAEGPMRVISGRVGKEKVHYQAPDAVRLSGEMGKFFEWFNAVPDIDLVVKAALAHLWFVSIHPFDDGNGRIARALTDLTLARSEDSANRFYSMSAQICSERKEYYDVLETTQKGTLDITRWMKWFLDCLERAFQKSELVLANVLIKAKFWEVTANQSLSERQIKILNLMLEDSIEKLSTSKWAKIGKCSQDTAHRDITDLIDRDILSQNQAGGRSTSYSFSVSLLAKIRTQGKQ